MNLLIALNRAYKEGKNINVTEAFNVNNTNYTPGLFNPRFLRVNLSDLPMHYLVNEEMWELEEDKVTITKSDLIRGMAKCGLLIRTEISSELWKELECDTESR